MVEPVQVVTISVDDPQIVPFHELGFDHADDFPAELAIAVNKLDGIPKGIAGFHGCHEWGLSGKLRFDTFNYYSLGYLQ
jgi:hypothetical protein